MGPSQLWKGCLFVAILNLPGKPVHSAPFLLTFPSTLLVGSNLLPPSHQELSTRAAFVIGMPQIFSCRDGKLVW